MKNLRVIGLMSGTSLDGLDVVDVTFYSTDNEKWSYTLNHSNLFSFDKKLAKQLKDAFFLSANELIQLSVDLGRFYAEKVNQFLQTNKVDKSNIDFIASHGQTIFHQPEKGYTLQIGNGPELVVGTNLPTVVDFRTKDVALGGNGAPLIPVADHLLFSDYATSFLNLGGFSNFSFKRDGKVLSYDICPVNIVVNDFMREMNKEFDEGGRFGQSGEIDATLLKQLNTLSYYSEDSPKSLGWEWVKKEMFPLINEELQLADKIRTYYEHIAFQIGEALNKENSQKVLITGGGAKNEFLISRIKHYVKAEVIIPHPDLIDFKEAIGFAFLGALRWRGKINVWSSVTGAKRNTSSGVIIKP